MGPTIMWDVNPHDWQSDDAAEIAHAALTNIRPASIVDLHDGLAPAARSAPSSRATVDALDMMLTEIRKLGLETVIVSDGIVD